MHLINTLWTCFHAVTCQNESFCMQGSLTDLQSILQQPVYWVKSREFTGEKKQMKKHALLCILILIRFEEFLKTHTFTKKQHNIATNYSGRLVLLSDAKAYWVMQMWPILPMWTLFQSSFTIKYYVAVASKELFHDGIHRNYANPSFQLSKIYWY